MTPQLLRRAALLVWLLVVLLLGLLTGLTVAAHQVLPAPAAPAPSPSPTQLLSPHGCYPPSCHLVRPSAQAAPAPTRASRSRTTPAPYGARWFDVTMYCETGSRTASGVWPRRGMAATLDRRIPFGTRYQVPGWGPVVVTDRIGHGATLDLYGGTDPGCPARARQWGRQQLRVVVLP